MSFRRPARGLLPILLLLMAILATGAAAVRAYRTTRVHDELVHRVLAEYAEVASWSYRRHLEETLRSAGRELLGPVDHGAGLHLQPPVPHAGDLAHYIPYDAACLCHIPRDGPIPHDLLAFTLGADTIGVGVNRYTHTERGWLVDMVPGIPSPPQPAADFGDRYRWVLDTLSSHIRRGPDTRSGWLVRSADARPHLLAYQQMPTAWGDTIVYVAGYNANTLTALLTTVLDGEDLLPPALTRRFTNRDVLRLEVTTADGTVLLQTDTSDVWSLDSHVPIDAQYGALRVRTQIRPAVASALMIGGTPRSQLPLLLGLLALATALSIVAFRQLARESQLSRARSDFVASVSHELRTPLAQLRLFLETMRLGRADDEQSRSWSLDQMDRESRRLVHLVDNVLIFSRGPARLIDAPRERIDIATLTNEITAEYAPLAAARRACSTKPFAM